MRTLAEAYDEFLGLANEAERVLEILAELASREELIYEDQLNIAVIHQLVELSSEALNTCRSYEYRMQVASRLLAFGELEGLDPQSGPTAQPDASGPSDPSPEVE